MNETSSKQMSEEGLMGVESQLKTAFNNKRLYLKESVAGYKIFGSQFL